MSAETSGITWQQSLLISLLLLWIVFFGSCREWRPWYAPENQGVPHTYKHASIVTPPRYDTNFIVYWFRLGNPNDRGTSLAVGQNHDGRLEVFLIGTANDIWHNWQLPGTSDWSGWERLGNPNDRGINLAVGRNADGRLEVFLIGTANDIWHTWQTAANNGWIHIP